MTDATPRTDQQESDDLLLSELATAMRELSEPPSPPELDAARAARERVGRDERGESGQLADLAFDSLLEDALAVRSAGLAAARQLTFYADDATLHVEVTTDLLVCRIDTGAQARVTLVTPDGTRRELTSVGGDRYELADPPAGPVRLECEGAGIVTTWFRL